jgi:hypothetical protein
LKSLTVHHCLVDVAQDGLSIFFERGVSKYDTLKELMLNCSRLVKLYPGISKQAAFEGKMRQRDKTI